MWSGTVDGTANVSNDLSFGYFGADLDLWMKFRLMHVFCDQTFPVIDLGIIACTSAFCGFLHCDYGTTVCRVDRCTRGSRDIDTLMVGGPDTSWLFSVAEITADIIVSGFQRPAE